MFVNAPYRGSNGVTSVYGTHTYYSSSKRFLTQIEAELAVKTTTLTTHPLSGESTRRDMQSGRTGPGRFRPTGYSCDYHESKSRGELTRILSSGSGSLRRFFGERRTYGFNYSGAYSSGFGHNHIDQDPSGLSSRWMAIANRMAIGNASNECTTTIRIRAMNSKLDLAEGLSGLPKTAIMIAERTSQVLNAWNAMRKGRIKAALRYLGITRHTFTTKSLANMWLEIAYGWKPLLSDIWSGAQVVNDYFNPSKKPPTFFATAKKKGTLLIDNPRTPDGVRCDVKTEAKFMVKKKITFRVNDPYWAYLNSLQVLNPAYVLWVNLPFSFVLDWFVPVGSMMQALVAPIGLDIVGGFSTTTSSADTTVTITKVDSTSPIVWEILDSTLSAKTMYMRRVPITNWPYVLPYFRFPFSSNQRLASAISLLEKFRR